MRIRRSVAETQRHWVILLLLWAPIAVSFPVAMLMKGGPDAVEQAFWGARSMFIAGGLGVGVWWLSGRLRWPEHRAPGFYALHVLLAALFSSVWWALSVFHGVLLGTTTLQAVLQRQRTNPWLGWDLVFGGLLYAAIASVSYMIRMREAFREERLNALRSDAALARARLTILQAQLNPHFLFNTLHSLSSLVRQDAQLAEEALDQFGELMRYSLDNVDSETVLLREEWKFTRDYLALEALRMGDRMTVVTEVDAEALSHAVPPFCLQPLVENAIRHGIGPRPEGGRIMIAITTANGELSITVADDGVGANVEALDGSEGLGLQGIKQRLGVAEGVDGRFEVDSRPGHGLTATIVLRRVSEISVVPGVSA